VLFHKFFINDDVVSIGNIVYNPARHNPQHGVNNWQLTARKSELFSLLYQRKREIISRKILLKKLRGDDNFFNARSLDVFITKLRKHLSADPQVQLINIRGVGYRLVW
jgi:DNA-binding response OmpR family regulator